MSRRITLEVDVDLDAVPGTFHDPISARNSVQAILDRAIPHYQPLVDYDPDQED